MKFHKALKLLQKGKAKSISSKQAQTYEQTLESLELWICADNSETSRRQNWKRFITVTDWTVDK